MNAILENTTNIKKVDPWTGSALQFINPKGKNLAQKFTAFEKWGEERNNLGIWPFGKINNAKFNFALFDYLGLSKHPEVLNAAHMAIDEYGISSSSSPSLNGRTPLSRKLEIKTAEILNKETCLIYPSGWAACFGAVAAIANSKDTIIIDQFAHNCLSTAAKSATKKLFKFKHNNLEHLAKLLKESREKDHANSLVIVLESLYSMNSTSPDLAKVMQLAHRYDAIVIIDVAHELGCDGKKGLGILETIDLSDERLVVAGSYSKVFGTNGGFVAGPKCIRQHFVFCSPTYTFSSAIAPMQCSIILKSLEIAFSSEGDLLRQRLKDLSLYARKKFIDNGFAVDGKPSVIIPVVIGEERLSREMFRDFEKDGLLVNLIEFPVVQRGRSLFRLLLSPLKSFEEIDMAVDTIVKAGSGKCTNQSQTFN